jgi:hypothetical protein
LTLQSTKKPKKDLFAHASQYCRKGLNHRFNHYDRRIIPRSQCGNKVTTKQLKQLGAAEANAERLLERELAGACHSGWLLACALARSLVPVLPP